MKKTDDAKVCYQGESITIVRDECEHKDKAWTIARRNCWDATVPWWKDYDGSNTTLKVMLWHELGNYLRMRIGINCGEGYLISVDSPVSYSYMDGPYSDVLHKLTDLMMDNNGRSDPFGERMAIVRKAVTVLFMTLRMGDE